MLYVVLHINFFEVEEESIDIQCNVSVLFFPSFILFFSSSCPWHRTMEGLFDRLYRKKKKRASADSIPPTRTHSHKSTNVKRALTINPNTRHGNKALHSSSHRVNA